MQKISSKLLRVEKLAENDIYQYDFDFGGQHFIFEPGQFFMLEVPSDDGKIITRAYSVASPPSVKDHFSLCVKLIPNGKASEYFRRMKVGDLVGFQGPVGHFTLKDSPKDIVMVATGTGIAPFMSMLPILFDREFEGRITLIFGVRYEEDLFYGEELDVWADTHSNFTLIRTLSRPTDNWQEGRGRVTEYFEEQQISPDNTKLYICGNGSMVKDVKTLAEAKGLSREDIHMELFTPVF